MRRPSLRKVSSTGTVPYVPLSAVALRTPLSVHCTSTNMLGWHRARTGVVPHSADNDFLQVPGATCRDGA